MIDIRVGELADADTVAVLRPVSTDFSPVTPAMRRLELEAGPAVATQCRQLGDLPLGSAAITGAGDLPAEFMVHVAICSPHDPVTETAVRQALLNGLRRLGDWGLDSVAMPPLGTGAGNLDPELAARLMVEVIRDEAGEALSRIVFVVENEYERDAFERATGGAPDDASG